MKIWRSLGPNAALIILLTVVAYLPVLHGGFVFDDYPLIIDNRIVKASDGLHRFWLTTEPPDYYPLTWSLWWLEWRLWGNSPAGYHVVNVLLHAINSVLVWLIMRRLKIPGAWLAGLVFALHPVNVATVAWISEQKNTLSMFFYALAVLLYLRFDEEAQPFAAKGWSWYGLSLAAFLLALLSKTAVVMLPVVLLGCVWWRRGRVRWKDFLCSTPFFAFSLVMGLVTIWFQHYRALEGHAVRTAGFPFRLAAAGWLPWFYLYKALLPFNLTVVYPKWEIDASRWVSYMPGVMLIGCFIVFWWRRRTWGRPLLFGLGYFVVMLFPVLGFIDQGFFFYSLAADHWQYYSIAGAVALAIAAGERICRRIGEWSQPIRVLVPLGTGLASVAVLMVLVVTTWRRGSVYADDETLWRDTLAKNPDAFPAYNGLGFVLAEQGKLTEAIERYQKALQLKPDYAEAHNNLGVALGRAGRLQEAIAHYEQALRIKPNMAEGHNNLGAALGQAGKVTEAIEHFEQALRIRPDFAGAHYNLGAALAQLGRLQEGIRHWEQAVRIDPDYAKAHNSLGRALVRLGRVPEAIKHLEQALRIRPDYAEAHYNLGFALEEAGRIEDAVGHYEQALRLKPDYTEARKRLEQLRAGQ